MDTRRGANKSITWLPDSDALQGHQPNKLPGSNEGRKGLVSICVIVVALLAYLGQRDNQESSSSEKGTKYRALREVLASGRRIAPGSILILDRIDAVPKYPGAKDLSDWMAYLEGTVDGKYTYAPFNKMLWERID